MIDERLSSSYLRKTISDPQTGIEPATFWRPERRTNHWATEAQMATQVGSSTCAAYAGSIAAWGSEVVLLR